MASSSLSLKCMSLIKFKRKLYVMAMKTDAKREEELTCQFKIGKEFDEF